MNTTFALIVGLPVFGADALVFERLFIVAAILTAIAGVVAAGLICYFTCRFAADTFRFGRERYPWPWFVILAGLFSSAACVLAGPVGVSFGATFLAIYALGRWRGTVDARKPGSLNGLVAEPVRDKSP